MRIVLTPCGSAGDVFPFIALGRRLKAAGHEVSLITASLFRSSVERAGLDFHPIGADADFESMIRDPRVWRLTRGPKVVFEFGAQLAEDYLDAIRSKVEAGEGPDLILAPVLAFGSRVARERFRIPMISVHLQPAVLLSAHQTPALAPGFDLLMRCLPVGVKRWLFRVAPNPLDLFAGPGLRRLLQKHGQEGPRRFYPEWWDSPDGVLLLFPHWFAAPQPDWPQPHLQTGFPLEDLALDQAPSADLERFLERHSQRPPVLFSPGSANVQAQDFFREGLAAARRLERPAVCLTRDLSQLPPDLPDSVFATEFAPFSQVLPRCAAFAHHGGVGTSSQALAAGVPQLIMPMAHDQPDNARRLRNLGVGDFLRPSRFRVDPITEKLSRLISGETVAAACERYRQQVKEDRVVYPESTWMPWLVDRQAQALRRMQTGR